MVEAYRGNRGDLGLRSATPKKIGLVFTVCFLAAALFVWDSAQARGEQPPQTGAKSLDRGKWELEQRRYGMAVRLFSDAIAEDPNLAQAFRLRAQAYEQTSRPHLALRDYDRYLALRPSDANTHIRRGDLLNLNLEHRAAMEDYERALKLKPSAVAALLGRGLALVALGRYPEAIEDYRRILELEPSNTDVLANLGIAYLLYGQANEASEYLERALQHEQDTTWRSKLKSWLEQLAKNRTPGLRSLPPDALRLKPGRPLW
jgi:tetratricopeptide (TPR) repeat protein